METLNRDASEIMVEHNVHAATDVTGFGLIGHLREMTAGKLGASVDARAVPLLIGALDLAEQGIAPGGTHTNLANAVAAGVLFGDGISQALRMLLCDAQTSGGLLIAIAPERSKALQERLRERGVGAAEIGTLNESGTIQVD